MQSVNTDLYLIKIMPSFSMQNNLCNLTLNKTLRDSNIPLTISSSSSYSSSQRRTISLWSCKKFNFSSIFWVTKFLQHFSLNWRCHWILRMKSTSSVLISILHLFWTSDKVKKIRSTTVLLIGVIKHVNAYFESSLKGRYNYKCHSRNLQNL